ncbi:MAG: peptidylprolyl isomerase [Gemmatimonadota bacterium]|nr:peptidylprolyl isomerase [Gemmatimonadota bacterium]
MKSPRLAVIACAVGVALTFPVSYARAQAAGTATPKPSRADSVLLGRILAAEDRRDATDAALSPETVSANPWLAPFVRRARARIGDARFAGRDSLGALPAPPVYAEPAWRLRFRALTPKTADCAAIRAALADEAWPVRLRAADLATATCAGDAALVATLRSWLPTADARTRARDGAAWQPAAHALVALARVLPAEGEGQVARFSGHQSHWVRVYAARAAAVVRDTQALRRLARDANHNVQETAIDALTALSGHADDAIYTEALAATGYQAVRAGARALKGAAPSPELRRALVRSAQRLRGDSSETSRDARLEVLTRLAEVADASVAADVAALAVDFDCEVAARAAAIASAHGAPTLARCTPLPRTLPADAVRLALGDDVRLRVVMAPTSGGGSFVVRLRSDVAPVMAARVLALVRARFYDGRAWHRVEPDFVIQGPSPDDNEYVGHPRFLRDELGTVPHARGTVGMSTRGHDTGDAQWFVNLKDNLRLGRDYTVFGEIIEGIEVADGVLEGDVIARIEVVGGR